MKLPRRIVLLLVLPAFGFLAAPAHADYFPATVVDGPSASIVGLDGLAVSHDGTGALVELKQDAGADHVFVSRLVGGVWQAPERLDGAMPDASSQPVVAVGDGGEVLVAFVNDGGLYVVHRLAGATAWPAPQGLQGGGVTDPSIALSVHDKGYLAYTAPGAGGHDVRIARMRGGAWAIVPAPLDAHPEDDAGVGSGRPAVAAAGDGEAVVVWGENGSVIARRVWDVNPSVTFASANAATFGGEAGGAAGYPEVGVGDDSSFALVTFQQQFAQAGTGTVERGLARRLRGSAFDDPIAVDGLSVPVGDNAQPPAQSLDNHAAGLIATGLQSTHQTWATPSDQDAGVRVPTRLDTVGGVSVSDPAPALGRDDAGLVAWQADGGAAGGQIVARLWDGEQFAAQSTLSSPAYGATDADAGLLAGADRTGDVAVAWIQGGYLMAGGFDKPPAAFAEKTTAAWQRRRKPLLKWTEPTDLWGGVTYTVKVAGFPLGTTRLTHLEPPVLPDGAYRWQVIATDRHGQVNEAVSRLLEIDSTKPTVKVRITGHKHAGKAVKITVTERDAPPAGTPPTTKVTTSGIARTRVDFGDGSPVGSSVRSTHHYRKGKYTVRVSVTDRAGNATVVKTKVKIGK